MDIDLSKSQNNTKRMSLQTGEDKRDPTQQLREKGHFSMIDVKMPADVLSLRQSQNYENKKPTEPS